MKNKQKEIYIFNDVDISCVAAIEYVIYKYGNENWFNAALNKVVTDIYSKNIKDICHTPFIIIKQFLKSKEMISLTYLGYHYIIYQTERYANKYNTIIS